MLIFGLLDVPNWLIITTIILIGLYLYGVWPYSYWKKRGINGPPMLPYLGDLPSFIKLGFRRQMVEQINQYGRIYGTFMLRNPSLVVADMDMLKQICIKEFDNFTDRGSINSMKPLDRGILALKEQEWKRVRSLLTPSFSSGKLKGMFPLIEEASLTLCKQMEKVGCQEPEISIKDYCVNFTLDVIASTMFGMKINCQENPDNSFKKYGKKIFDMSPMSPKFLFLVLFPSIALPLYSKFNISLAPTDALDFFIDIITGALKERRKPEYAGKYKDFLASMVTARDDAEKSGLLEETAPEKGLSEDEVLAQCLTFFLAGFETTANAMHYVIYFLALNPDCAEKVYQEIKEAGELNYDTVMSLRYLGQCIDESMRMCPPALLSDRVCTKTTTIKGYELEKGLNIRIPIYYLAHDPEIWSEAETFNPDRFTPENSSDRNSFAYIPFGSGPRNCIGMRFAQMEMRKGLAELLVRFTFEPVASTKTFDKMEFKQAGILTPKEPIILKVRPRKSS